MPKSANPFSPRIVALALLFPVFACSRATPPVPTAATSAASAPASATHSPSQQATQASAPAEPPQPPLPTAGSATAVPAVAVSASAAPPLGPAPHARASLWTKPQDCSVYDTSPDYRGLSVQDRAHGRLTCEIKEQFRAFVAGRQTCKSASDCAIVSGSCPFDCYVPIAKASEREVRAQLDSLGARLDKAGNRCMYGCMGSPAVECVGGRCDAGNP